MCTVHSEEGLRPKRCVTKIILVKKCSPTHFAPSILPIRLRLPMHSAPLYEILPIPLSVCLSLHLLYTSLSSPAFYSDPSGTATSAYELTVQINSSLVLSCGSILSTPSATYSWSYSDGTSIAANRDRAVKGIDGDLYLLLIEENNIDTYRCTAVNHLLFENKFVDITLSSNGELHSVYKCIPV